MPKLPPTFFITNNHSKQNDLHERKRTAYTTQDMPAPQGFMAKTSLRNA
jgi:hypothetical protein